MTAHCTSLPLLQPLRDPLRGEELLGSELDKVNRSGEGRESLSLVTLTKCNLSKIKIIGDKNKTGGISLALHIE